MIVREVDSAETPPPARVWSSTAGQIGSLMGSIVVGPNLRRLPERNMLAKIPENHFLCLHRPLSGAPWIRNHGRTSGLPCNSDRAPLYQPSGHFTS
jgi:hypothetical protein